MTIRASLFAFATAAGCAAGPTTGQSFDGETAGKVLPFNGYIDTAGGQVRLYALSDPDGDPALGPYTQIGSTTAAMSPTSGMNDPAHPAYYWNASTTPLTTALWPRGGLLRLKARGVVSGAWADLASFDESGPGCAYNAILGGQAWWSAGQNCQTPYPRKELIVVASAEPVPALENAGGMHYLSVRGGVPINLDPPEVTPLSTAAATQAYYDLIGAPPTLTAFKNTYGFGAAGSNQVRAVYYNAGDLGIGRDMNCKTQPVPGGVVTACYVSNHGRGTSQGNAPVGFGTEHDDPSIVNIALGQALGPPQLNGPNTPLATVAMVHDTSKPADRRVQFMVYDKLGARSTLAPLDNDGLAAFDLPDDEAAANLAVPQNCLTCHGPQSSYTPSVRSPGPVLNARFLPFDPDAYLFATNQPVYTKALMLPNLKKLNAFVWDTNPVAPTVELLKGMYPSADGTGPKNASSQFDPSYIPVAWQGGEIPVQMYQKVVKPYCRTCHVANELRDWNTWQEFSDQAASIEFYVCTNNSSVPMPQAEQVQSRMWRTGARAHLAAAFEWQGACAPTADAP